MRTDRRWPILVKARISIRDRLVCGGREPRAHGVARRPTSGVPFLLGTALPGRENRTSSPSFGWRPSLARKAARHLGPIAANVERMGYLPSTQEGESRVESPRRAEVEGPLLTLFAPEMPKVESRYRKEAQVVIAPGDCLEILPRVPQGSIQLIITSPPYNLGKAYEKETSLGDYIEAQRPAVTELLRVLAPSGSLCWQVGNYVKDSEIFPLDIFYYPFFKAQGLRLRNRIVWHFDHGLHASKRFSGRYEVMLWFTKGDDYIFNLDSVRVPAKYPGKLHYKGKNRGKPSGNPLGKNPSDIWRIVLHDWETALWDIPNVKSNHPEKTIHPCQFPIELVERCVLALTNQGDWVLDPYSGVGSALLAALRHGRRAMGCEKEGQYLQIATERIAKLYNGVLPYRQLGRPIHQPSGRERVSQIPLEWQRNEQGQ